MGGQPVAERQPQAGAAARGDRDVPASILGARNTAVGEQLPGFGDGFGHDKGEMMSES